MTEVLRLGQMLHVHVDEGDEIHRDKVPTIGEQDFEEDEDVEDDEDGEFEDGDEDFGDNSGDEEEY